MPADSQAVDGFNATIQHAVLAWQKAEMLREQSREALRVALGLMPRIDYRTIDGGYQQLKAADVGGRKPVYDELRRRRFQEPTHIHGEAVRRKRGSNTPWPTAAAWVYILLGDQDDVLYIGKSKNPKTRVRDHSGRIPWCSIELVACSSEAEALRIEGDLIFQHKPPWNVRDVQVRRRSA